MTPGDASEWRRLNLRLAFILEAREQALKDLRMLRYETPAEPDHPAWEGFSGDPPYPVDAIVNLYAHIYAMRGEIETLAVRRAIQEASLTAFLKAREASEQQLRQAEELLARAAGKRTRRISGPAGTWRTCATRSTARAPSPMRFPGS